MKSSTLILLTSSLKVIDYIVSHYGKERLLVLDYSSSDTLTDFPDRYQDIIFISAKKADISAILHKQSSDSICLSCFSGYIFSRGDINHFSRPILNFHTGKIPDNRGRCPLFWDIVEEREFSYGTLHSISTEIDMGIALQEVSVKIDPIDNPKTLADKLLDQAFEFNIFLTWISISPEKISSLHPVSSTGVYKKAFNPNDNFSSSLHSMPELLRLWRCFQIWGSICIDNTHYSGLYEDKFPDTIPILSKCGNFVYGVK